MTILQIIQYPDLRLRRKSYRVGNVKAVKIQKTIEDMVETLNNQESCAGLAATQLDIEDPPNITVINNTKNPIHSDILCLINLQIISAEGETIEDEGCMSLYPKNIYTKIKRAAKIRVSALDIQGNKIEFAAEDHFARCIQHEYDHLQGLLYIDHLSKIERSCLDKKIAKLTNSS